eukprot:201872-Chlamydomonas_euryale.AAC.9
MPPCMPPPPPPPPGSITLLMTPCRKFCGSCRLLPSPSDDSIPSLSILSNSVLLRWPRPSDGTVPPGMALPPLAPPVWCWCCCWWCCDGT